MKHCLVVDDSRVIRKVACRILETLQFATEEAEDGAAALDACRSRMPDVILLDWQMPHMTGIEFLRNELGDKDESGRARPVPIPGSEFVAELDTLVVAISEEPETDALEGFKLKPWGGLVINPESYVTSQKRVFGGGDMVTGPSTVIEAVAAGKNAAVMIDRQLTGRQLKVLPKVLLPTVYVEPFAGEEEVEATGRAHPEHLPVDQRKKNFREVDLCFTEDHAQCEARRCLRCDIEFTQPV